MNFQVVGAGSAYNRPGQHQRTKRHFWVLFLPKKSTWRAQENAEVYSEDTRDIPLHIPALPFTSAQAISTPGKNSWMNFQVVGAGSAYNRPGKHQRIQGISRYAFGLKSVPGTHQKILNGALNLGSTNQDTSPKSTIIKCYRHHKNFLCCVPNFLLRGKHDDFTIAPLLDDSQSEYITADIVARR
ncbi:hypothetical protein P0Y67_12975 [Photobacterium sp. SP02]|uniref:hypothetical protein n=1 Tax=Photobacterium sp. SP02 TaxID=3032280 RepID=UPI0031455EDC